MHLVKIFGEKSCVLYKVSILQQASEVGDGTDFSFGYLSLEALMKTQSDDVRLNCVGQFSTSLILSFLCFISVVHFPLFKAQLSKDMTYHCHFLLENRFSTSLLDCAQL